MPIVFVHGVNTRTGPSYDAGIRAVQKFLQAHLTGVKIGGKTLVQIPNVGFPYWGNLGAKFAWNMDSLPRGDMQSLGGSADVSLQPLLAHLRDVFPTLPRQQPLIALAKKQLSLAVDVINDLALQNVTKGDEDAVAEFVVEASAYADANPHPSWLEAIATDEQFLSTLRSKLIAQPDIQALGGFGAVFNKLALAAARFKQAAQSMAGKAVDETGNFVSTKLLAATRGSLNAVLGRFFGDVFLYLDLRGTVDQPGPIPALILQAFDAARGSAPNEPFIVIGHSLGGVIAFDLLSYFRPDIEVDLFVSVGSQVGHFEEMKLYKSSDIAVGQPNRAKTPQNINRWINIYDEVDIFAYSVERIFDRVNVDARYDTETYTIKAHGAYLDQDRFYKRLRARIDVLP